MRWSSPVYLVVWVFAAITGRAQVANNSIQQRSELLIDGPSLHSTTAQSTVEWNCINNALTRKCLVYHNDQWFYFKPLVSGTYYINIAAQHCRDMQGVQLIVIEGNPCEVNTYRILECLPKIFQDDVFVTLNSLHANTLYLINIDGFLGDFCEFDIGISQKPKGLPVEGQSLDTLNLTTSTDTRAVHLTWQADQKLLESIANFEIHRKKYPESKSVLTSILSAKANARGEYKDSYSISDTLVTSGTFHYRIVGVGIDGSRTLLDETKIVFQVRMVPRVVTVEIPFSFSAPGRVEIFVIHELDYELLDYRVHEYEKLQTHPIQIQKFVNAGIRQFRIRLRHNRTKEVRQFLVKVNELGEAVLEVLK